MATRPDPDVPSVCVTPRAAEKIRGGHPWVYRDGIAPPAPEGFAAGCLVRVVDRRGAVLGSAFFSPTAPITLRMLSREEIAPERVAGLLAERIARANQRRLSLLAPGQDAYRVVHGEADLLPGLFVDRYADVAVIQSVSAALDAREPSVAEELVRQLGVRLVVARDDGSARDFEELPRRRGILLGDGPTRVVFHDAGSLMEADVLTDGKTGAFLDQQENHARAAEYVRAWKGEPIEALDAFSYHGGFALGLARAGARVTALDENAAAVERLRANATRNQLTLDATCGNAFDALRAYEASDRRFDLVVLDPPALAKRKSALPAAERAYKELNLRALRILRPGGILVSCSCSAKMTGERFGAVLEAAAHDAHRPVQLLERRGAGRDHPLLVGAPETEYLKCWVMRVVE